LGHYLTNELRVGSIDVADNMEATFKVTWVIRCTENIGKVKVVPVLK
jgi:hypothetical protein